MATTPTDVHVPAGAPAPQDPRWSGCARHDGRRRPHSPSWSGGGACRTAVGATSHQPTPRRHRRTRAAPLRAHAALASAQARRQRWLSASDNRHSPCPHRPPDRRREWDRGGRRTWNRRSCALGPSARGQAPKDPQAPGSRSRRLPRRWLRARPASDRSRRPRLTSGGRGGSAPNCDGTDTREVARLARAAADAVPAGVLAPTAGATPLVTTQATPVTAPSPFA